MNIDYTRIRDLCGRVTNHPSPVVSAEDLTQEVILHILEKNLSPETRLDYYNIVRRVMQDTLARDGQPVRLSRAALTKTRTAIRRANGEREKAVCPKGMSEQTFRACLDAIAGTTDLDVAAFSQPSNEWVADEVDVWDYLDRLSDEDRDILIKHFGFDGSKPSHSSKFYISERKREALDNLKKAVLG